MFQVNDELWILIYFIYLENLGNQNQTFYCTGIYYTEACSELAGPISAI